jgi:DAK2 domain fusion protein YloV
MIYTQLDGALYCHLLDYGIRNLALHCDEVNAMNVFPVPDGDTGTNMVTTLRNGYMAISDPTAELADVAKQFSTAVVYGARGNSGVIVSQFFKGFSESLYSPVAKQSIGFDEYVAALQQGVRYAYDAVSHPTEGTILTVMREATDYVTTAAPCDLAELLRLFLHQARISLENTPNLLPILKQAGVVDSGAVGIICVFEGMLKYLSGDTVEETATIAGGAFIDYSQYHKNSHFEFGYCTEFLLQLLDSATPFYRSAFLTTLETLGDSIVCSVENDKVKVHVHTTQPEKVLALAHAHGEFLSVKLENMSVQHTALQARESGSVNKGNTKPDAAFAVIVVSHSESITELFNSMGADVVITLADGETPSAQQFIQAFDLAGCDNILVFPNNPNDVMTAEQACALYGRGNVVILNSKSVADCYAALALIDYACDDVDRVISDVNRVIDNVYAVRLTAAARDAVYGGVTIRKGDRLALHASSLLAVDANMAALAIRVIADTMRHEDKDTITIFRGQRILQDVIDAILDFISQNYCYTEANLVSTEDSSGDLILSFE